MQQSHLNPVSQGSISGRLAAVRADALRSDASLSRDGGGYSLAEMAQRDLDAALQLLADRAQYITGATGAAIALLRDGRKDMLCRASTGPNAPELGALLSTEFGLSGESVRTKQFLRCDDAERDARVNREVCRQRGIASVVVMPVVNDDGVLGVFELFSGKANAFADRDVSAVQRLSEMVETAVRLARAAEKLPEKLNKIESLGPPKPLDSLKIEEEDTSEEILDEEIFAEHPVQSGKAGSGDTEVLPEAAAAAKAGQTPTPSRVESAVRTVETLPKLEEPKPAQAVQREIAARPPAPEAHEENAAPPKKLFWSAAVTANAEPEKAAEADQSHVPPVLRALRKCEACGFPITAGRVLCVECEEKKWRGQLKRPAVSDRAVQAPMKSAVPALKKEPPGNAAAAHTTTKPSSDAVPTASGIAAAAKLASAALIESEASRVKAHPSFDPAPPAVNKLAAEPTSKIEERAAPAFEFSGGLDSSQSWFSANKYVLLVLLVVAAVVAVFVFLR